MSHAPELITALRAAFETIPEDVAHHGTEPPAPSSVYVVPGHESALNPDTAVVVGDRGTGKSFWSAALNGESTRILIGKQLKRVKLDSVKVSWGYSSATSNQHHPSRRSLKRLLEQGYRPEDIWRTVILFQLIEDSPHRDFLAAASWEERVATIAENPEVEERLFAELDAALKSDGVRHLIVFDALDRLGDDWAQIRTLLRGLLRVGLDLRDYRAIRTKFFLRPDLWEDSSVWAFPDASKLTHGRVLLEWHRADLYGLLWHQLGNDSQAGPTFRQWLEERFGERFEALQIGTEVVYVVPEALRSRDELQAEVLQAIASPFMGRNRRRGKTYTWLPTHLADAKGQISPRSFLIALKRAHTITERHHGEAQLLLHFEGIKHGVQEASRVRLRELKEDYSWIEQLLEPLRGMTVPAGAEEIKARWQEHAVAEAIHQAARESQADDDASRPYLLPHALESQNLGQGDEDALIEAAVDIGVMNRTAEQRLNIPDLFRVAAGIGRRGGVRAIR